MSKITTLLGAGALLFGITTPTFSQPAPGSISPNHDTGQQVGGEDGLECEDGVAPGSTTRQHEQGDGSPFQEESTSGEHYAGEQDTNNKNTASVSQYDLACFTAATPTG